MESLISIISLLLLAVNLPLAVAVHKGIKFHAETSCPDEIRAVETNKKALKAFATIDAVLSAVLLLIAMTL